MFADVRTAFRPFHASASRLSAAAVLAVAALAAAAGPASAADPLGSVVSTREMLSRLNQPWVQLIDVRSADEYAGRDIRALRGGHIPGAISVPVSGGDDLATMPARLKQLDLRKETVVYGHDSAIAAQLAERLRQQGFLQVRVYADAWPVWANTLEMPVASERYADVGALRDRLVELQRMIERLSRPGLASQQLDAAR